MGETIDRPFAPLFVHPGVTTTDVRKSMVALTAITEAAAIAGIIQD